MTESEPREIEAKFRLRDRVAFEAALKTLGATSGARVFESNELLDDDSASLRRKGMALRIREVGRSGLLTLKGKADFQDGIKSRLELESGVEAPARVQEILARLGYTTRFRYEKWRTTWRFPEPSRPIVVVDETPLGLFSEVEGSAEGVRALLVELGIPERELLAGSYAALWWEARQKDPSLAADMVFG